MAGDQVQVYSAGNPMKAELIRQMLGGHEIPAFIINKQDSAYQFGDVEIYVHRDHVIRAKKLLEEYEQT